MKVPGKCLLWICWLKAVFVAPTPTVQLSNGVDMPLIALGMGPWCHTPKCPPPQGPCGDCYNNTEATADVLLAFKQGFAAVDTALGYGNQQGVGVAVNDLGRENIFLQTKVPVCTGDNVTACAEQTFANVQLDLDALNVSFVDSILLHSPPTGHGSMKGQACAPGILCDLAVAQWTTLEHIYEAGKARSIGVSNYCQRCLECLQNRTTVVPMVNQIQYHAGMPGADPDGLISYCKTRGIEPQAYSPLGNYATHSLLHANITAAIGRAHGVSPAQVGLRWVLQNNVSLVVAADNQTYLREDQAIFNWSLTDAEMDELNTQAFAPEGPTRGSCVG
eukprot:m.130316 g.130316  ORF g.130316 m.130316 type:complete len:333 (-) comp17466_c0_seq22:137-1135(-)